MLGSRELKELARVMIDRMRKAPGGGLAAPQIGVPFRVIVLEDSEALMARLTPEARAQRERTPFPLKVIVNPVLESDPRGGRATFFEGCLSVPGYMALVERDRVVIVTGVDENGGPVRVEATGWPARILQHEIDHLNGTLYVDRMLSRTFGANEEIAARWLALAPDAVRAELKA
jgi:peptide deformylase